MEETLPWLSLPYLVFFGLLLFSRGMDFLSTWVATPNLVLEGNPIARFLGWRGGLVVNLALCVGFAFVPTTATIVCTTSLLVAARNFQQAWLMRSMGEEHYRCWFVNRFYETPLPLFLGCLLGQTVLVALVGVAVTYLAGDHLLLIGVGVGIIGYAVAVLVFTLLSVWRLRRFMG